MAGIQLGGLFTGIDTKTLVSQLMAAERGTVNRYQLRQRGWSERQTALSDLEAKLRALKNSAANLASAQSLRAFNATSSDTNRLTVEASNSAFEGNHTVEINQLANAERWVHTAGKAYAQDSVGAGAFIYSYNRRETTLLTTSETTLEDLVGLVNNDPNNPGVTANLLYYNGAYHLMLNGNEAGSDYAISIHTHNTEIWHTASSLTKGSENAVLATRIIDLTQFDGTRAGDESITISGQQHDGTAVQRSFLLTANTTLDHLIREINAAFGGTATAVLQNGRIRLTDHTCGASQMELSLTYNAGSGSTTFDIPALGRLVQGGSVTAGLDGFAPADFAQTQSAQDSQIKVDGFPLGADEWISRSSNTIGDVIQGVTLRLQEEGTARVNLTRDTKSVRDRLNAIVSAYNAAIALYKEKAGYNTTTKVAGVLMGDSVVSNAADELRRVLLQQASGFDAALDSFVLPTQIGLELDKDGKLTLKTDVFDEAIARDHMGVLALIGADKTGSTDSNTIKFYGASSTYTAAGTYQVQVTVSEGIITSAKIKQEGQTEYREAVNQGNIILGDSTFSERGSPLYPENGLQLSVDRSVDGTFTATVRIQQGFAGAMQESLDRMVNADTGTLALNRKGMDDQIKHLQDQIAAEQKRLTQRQAVLTARFARMEKALALLRNQMAGLGFDTADG
ncbi:MAG: hypothetical protein FJ280_16195 [Planctomycetes bacterium]|nr:hypothetical protein [Planctomycetota bacterium]